ncbi:hypothetical protein [Streptomyces sp. SYSU K217416]
MGSPYCRKSAKESVVSSAWTPMVSQLRRELGRPVRILKGMGLRSNEGPDRKKRADRMQHLSAALESADEATVLAAAWARRSAVGMWSMFNPVATFTPSSGVPSTLNTPLSAGRSRHATSTSCTR